MSDELLALTMETVHKLEIKVPEQLALVSMSDGNLPHFLYPKITHIHHSGYEVGKAAVELLFQIIEEKVTPNSKTIQLPTHLVPLSSTFTNQ